MTTKEILTAPTTRAPVTVDLTAADARALTDRIRSDLTAAFAGLVEAWQGRADLALGYPSWDTYCDTEFAEARMLRLDREQRREIVGTMRDAGMSTRAIGSAIGASKSQVNRDAPPVPSGTPAPVTGMDGKTYNPKPRVVPAKAATIRADIWADEQLMRIKMSEVIDVLRALPDPPQTVDVKAVVQAKDIARGINALTRMCMGFSTVTKLDESISPAQAADWGDDLARHIAELRRVHDLLVARGGAS